MSDWVPSSTVKPLRTSWLLQTANVAMPRNWRLRPSRPGDIDQLYEVWYASVLATHAFLAESDLNEIGVLVRRDYLPNRDFTVAVDDNDRAIGFMRLEGDEIDSLFIAPAFRSQGLGRRFLVEAALRSAKLEVEVNAQNEQAIGFYQAMGFCVIASSPRDRNGRSYPLLRMRRQPVGRI
jgi:putative acetyltransferase